MKYKFLIASLLLSLLASSAFSAQSVFEGQSTWNTSGSFGHTDLNGIQFDAIRNALRRCRTAGHERCVLQNVHSTYSKSRYYDSSRRAYRYKTEYIARVRSIDNASVSFESESVFTEESGVWSSDARFELLETMGIQMDALTGALNNCYSAGHDFCAILEIESIMSNDRFYDYERRRYRRRSQARASVKGFRSENLQ